MIKYFALNRYTYYICLWSQLENSNTMVSKLIRQSAIRHIMSNGSFIISDITEDTGYSTTTVSKYISTMIQDGVIKEIDKVSLHDKGRPTVRYGLSSDNNYFLGVTINAFEIHLGLIDMAGKIIKIERIDGMFNENSYTKLDEICGHISDFIDVVNRENNGKILSANINLSGRVDSRKGTSATVFNLEETSTTPLVEILSERLGLQVFIENDTKAMAYGEYITHYKNSYKNMCYVNIGWGLGLGLILDGKLYYGKDGYSGEFGHVNLYNNNVLCHCGKKGCLETEVSGRAIIRKLTERITKGETSVLSKKVHSQKTITTSDLQFAIEKEDSLCLELVTETAKELGKHLAAIVNILNPDVIVLGGKLSQIESYYFQQYVQLSIRQYSLKLMSQDIPVLTSPLGEDAAVIGACLIARNKALLNDDII